MSDRFAKVAAPSVLAWVATLAASLALWPLFDGRDYLVVTIALTWPALVFAIVLRLARVPEPLAWLGQLLTFGLWTLGVYTLGSEYIDFVPTDGSLEQLRLLVESGLMDAQEYPAPAPSTAGLALLTALAVAGCYLLVDLLGVALRKAPLTGLPLLALYTAPAALAPDGVPALAFIPGALGYVAMLAYDERERLANWGRQLSGFAGASPEQQRRIRVSGLNVSAQRIGLAAVAASAVVPIVVPVLPENLFERGAGGAGGEGKVRVSNPIVDLRRDLVERSTEVAMTIRTDGAQPQYFRLASLDEFNGQSWRFTDRGIGTQYDLSGGLITPPGLASDTAVTRQTFQVEVADNFETDWLPSPYAPMRVRAPGEWRYDPDTLDIVSASDEQTAAGLRYRLTTIHAQPTAAQLAEAGGASTTVSGQYTNTPDSIPDEVEEIANQVTEGADSRFEEAVVLQDWFRSDGGFEYSLAPPAGHTGDDIMAFLDNRVGYCEQFAAAMALMARYLDIPSRVAVGFLNAHSENGEIWRYTYADLHAWPELYFEGAGWVTFEPTPASRDGSAAPSYTRGSPDGTEPPNNDSGRVTGELPETEPSEQPREQEESAVGGRQDPPGGGSLGPWPFVVLALVFLASVPALTRLGVRRARWSRARGDEARAEAAWAELRDTVRDLRHDWPIDTPRRTARGLTPLVKHDEAALEAVSRLALAVERARFARTPLESSALARDLQTAVDALKQRESRGDVIRAALLPRSLRGRYREENRRRLRFRNQTRDADANALRAAP